MIEVKKESVQGLALLNMTINEVEEVYNEVVKLVHGRVVQVSEVYRVL